MEESKMKTKTLWIGIAILIASMFIVGWTARGQSSANAWEYKIAYANMPFSQKEMNQEAADGWQFVECETYNEGRQALLVYKRAK
jgi:hypothetical protein